MVRLQALKSWVCGIAAASLLVAGTALADGRGGPGHGFGGHAGYGGHGGYGYHGGGYGYRGYGWRGGYWGGWGWGWAGLGLGLYAASLPLYYSTLWWEGVPYYYADNVYYRYDGAVGQYVTVAPPPYQSSMPPASAAPAGAASGSGVGTDVMAYPKNGQTADQQGKDKFECHRWAVGQTGFDPTQGAAATNTAKRGDYMRAQSACLDGRGYSVR